MANLKESSKQNWRSDSSIANINAGSLQRIADTTELMASNYLQLLDEAERYKGYHKENLSRIDSLRRSITAYKAVITRLKNKLQTKKRKSKTNLHGRNNGHRQG